MAFSLRNKQPNRQTTDVLTLYISLCGRFAFLKAQFVMLCCDNTVPLHVPLTYTWQPLYSNKPIAASVSSHVKLHNIPCSDSTFTIHKNIFYRVLIQQEPHPAIRHMKCSKKLLQFLVWHHEKKEKGKTTDAFTSPQHQLHMTQLPSLYFYPIIWH